jgi:hypothetical protein
MYLDDLMASGDLPAQVDNLARDLRSRYSFPPVHQLGLIVPDVEKAAQELETRGIGPFFIGGGAPLLWLERGENKKFKGKIGIAYHRSLEMELIEPGTGSDFYRNHVDPDGRIVLQHLGFLVDDVDKWADKMAADNYPLWIRGKLRAGPMSADYAYIDTLEEAGLVLEFIHWRFLGFNWNLPPGVFHAIGRLQKWSGKRSFSV